MKPLGVFFIYMLFAVSAAFAGDYPGTIPQINRLNSSFLIGTDYQHHHYAPQRLLCVRAHGPNHLKVALRITRKANEAFSKLRDFKNAFLDSRELIVPKYLHRTEYIEVFKRGQSLAKGTEGTLAVTWAEYDRQNPFSQILPEEETLSTRLPRPLAANGKGVVFEFRTFFLAKEGNQFIYPFILEQMSRVIFEKLREYPELYDEPIIHTYGDRAGVLLYKPMGFELSPITPKNRPISAYDQNWWALSMTPRQFEKLLLSLRIPDEETRQSRSSVYSWIPNQPTYIGFNQDLPAPMPGAPHAMAMAGKHLALGEDGKPASIILAADTRFEDGIVGAQGAHVVQYYGFVVIISKTAEDYLDPHSGKLIPKGSSLAMNKGRIIAVDGVRLDD